MRALRDFPIKYKLIGIIMLTSVSALLLACLGFIAYEQFAFRRTMVRDSSILADVIQDNVAPGLTFNDATEMEKTLWSMSAQPHILAGAVYDKAGKRVATYERNQQPDGFPWPARQNAGAYFQLDRLDTFQRIRLAGEVIGTLYIASDLDELKELQVRYALIGGLVLLLSGLAAYLFATRLQHVISDPISDLSQTASRVASEKDYALRAAKHGQDELGSLIDRFNEMLEQIQKQAVSLREANDQLEQRVEERTRELRQEIAEHQRAREELIQAQGMVQISRQAGMAEVATSVLHNVGNVLNSVSVSAEVVVGKVRGFRIGSLKSVAELLRQHAANLPEFLTSDPRGKELPDYLLKLAGRLAEPQQGILQELEVLRKNIEHIKEIVAMQQSHARSGGVFEALSLADLVEDALRINAAGFSRHEVDLIREFSPVPPVVTDRHRVLQILVNLLSNAKYALTKAATGDKRLIVRVTPDGTDGAKIEVIDSGVGIAPENLARIFQHGFTTKEDGHGFGLHSGALAAKELGGRLTVHSDGVGQGATFTLELPLQNNKNR